MFVLAIQTTFNNYWTTHSKHVLRFDPLLTCAISIWTIQHGGMAQWLRDQISKMAWFGLSINYWKLFRLAMQTTFDYWPGGLKALSCAQMVISQGCSNDIKWTCCMGLRWLGNTSALSRWLFQPPNTYWKTFIGCLTKSRKLGYQLEDNFNTHFDALEKWYKVDN